MARQNLDTIKLFAAADALQTFSVTQLMSYAQVLKASAAKFISRNRKAGFLEAGESIPSSRGRPVQLYRVVVEKIDELHALVENTRRGLRSSETLESASSAALSMANLPDETAPELVSALHTALYELPEAENLDEKVGILQRAWSDVAINAMSNDAPSESSKRQAVRTLLELCTLELWLELQERTGQREAQAIWSWSEGFRRVWVAFGRLLELLPQLDLETQTAIRSRLDTSPLLQSFPNPTSGMDRESATLESTARFTVSTSLVPDPTEAEFHSQLQSMAACAS